MSELDNTVVVEGAGAPAEPATIDEAIARAMGQLPEAEEQQSEAQQSEAAPAEQLEQAEEPEAPAERKHRDRELARKWRKYNREQEALRAERESLAAEQRAWRENPFAQIAKEQGKTVEEILSLALETYVAPPDKALSEVEKLKAEMAAAKREAEEIRAQAQRQSEVAAMRAAVGQIFKSNETLYTHTAALVNESLIDANQLYDAVLSEVEKQVEDLEPEEITQAVLDDLVKGILAKQEKEYSDHLAKLAKVMGIVSSPDNGKNGQAKPAKATTATLSARQAIAHAPTEEKEPATVDEAIARAMRIHGFA